MKNKLLLEIDSALHFTCTCVPSFSIPIDELLIKCCDTHEMCMQMSRAQITIVIVVARGSAGVPVRTAQVTKPRKPASPPSECDMAHTDFDGPTHRMAHRF